MNSQYKNRGENSVHYVIRNLNSGVALYKKCLELRCYILGPTYLTSENIVF